MGIRNRIKKRLPIFGRKTVSPAVPPHNEEPSKPTFEPASYTEPASPRGDKEVQIFLKDFIKENQIVIFMKGSPESPSCGFSANASAILASYGKEFAYFDVFLDQDVREGIKDFSQWPTLPQIYIGGEIIGGSDILTQMHQSGELKSEINALDE